MTESRSPLLVLVRPIGMASMMLLPALAHRLGRSASP